MPALKPRSTFVCSLTHVYTVFVRTIARESRATHITGCVLFFNHAWIQMHRGFSSARVNSTVEFVKSF